MIAGLGVTFYYMVTTQPWLRGIFGVTSPIELWWGIQPISAGVFGVPLGFAVIIIVSLLTAAPGRDVQELVEHVRYPNLKGDTLKFTINTITLKYLHERYKRILISTTKVPQSKPKTTNHSFQP